VKLIDRFIKWAARLPKGRRVDIKKDKPFVGLLEKDIPLDELFGTKKKDKDKR
jgi:hypothetical protein